MGDNSTLGLLFEISADPTKAQAALSQFQAQTQASTAVAAQATEDFGRRSSQSVSESSHAARLLAEDMGLHLPRAITSSIAQMEAFRAVASVAFQGAIVFYFVEQLVKLVSKTKDAEQAMGDFGKAAKEALQEITAEGAKVFTKFEGVLAGKLLLEGTKKHLDQLNQLRDAYKLVGQVQSGAMPANDAYAAALWKISDAARELKLKSLVDVEHATKETTALWALQSEQLLKLEKDRTKKEKEEEKARLEGVKRAHAERLKLEHENYEQLKQADQEYYRATKELRQQAAQDAKALVEEQTKLDKVMLQAGRATMPAWISQMLAAHAAQFKLTEAERAALPLRISETNQLAMMTQRSREMTQELTSGQLPARRRIELQVQRQLDIGWREVLQARQALAVC